MKRWFWVLSFLVCWPSIVFGQPVFAAEKDGVRIVLTDEPCALKDYITNMPYKATWTEKGKESQGCWGPRQDYEIVIGYFDDKTVAIIPMQAFKKLVGV